MDQGTSWMHQPKQEVDREAYLTGKRIDKAFENFLDEQLKLEKIKRQTVNGEKEADLYNKKLEDPLYQIREKEQNSKQRLKANPIKMRMMRQIFDEMMAEKLNPKKHKKSKKKKRKKSKNSDSESDSERKLNEYRNESRNKTSRSGNYKENDWNAERYRSSFINKILNKNGPTTDPRGHKIERKRPSENEPSKPKKSKLSSEDRAAKAAAMMATADKYQKIQTEKVKKSNIQQKIEEERDRASSFKGAGFVKDLKNSFAANETLEERIKSNKHKQLRSAADFSKNSFRR